MLGDVEEEVEYCRALVGDDDASAMFDDDLAFETGVDSVVVATFVELVLFNDDVSCVVESTTVLFSLDICLF